MPQDGSYLRRLSEFVAPGHSAPRASQGGCFLMFSVMQNIDKRAISIVIPFYNPGPFFVLALQSVFAQTYTDWELLLIDDGSTDDSLQIASRIDDPRVRVFVD